MPRSSSGVPSPASGVPSSASGVPQGRRNGRFSRWFERFERWATFDRHTASGLELRRLPPRMATINYGSLAVLACMMLFVENVFDRPRRGDAFSALGLTALLVMLAITMWRRPSFGFVAGALAPAALMADRTASLAAHLLGASMLDVARTASLSAPWLPLQICCLFVMTRVELAAIVALPVIAVNVAVLALAGPDGDGPVDVAYRYAVGSSFVQQSGVFMLMTGFGLLQRRSEGQSVRVGHLEAQARTDPLTGLLNRRAMAELVRAAVAVAGQDVLDDGDARTTAERQAPGRPADPGAHQDARPGCIALVLLDLDHFKRINDDHGHEAGDRILAQAAELIRHCVRGGDMVARWGGEEFVLLCRTASAHEALQAAERLRQAFASAPWPRQMAVTLSIGVAVIGPDDDEQTVLARADAALYEAKRSGRNRVALAHGPDGGVTVSPEDGKGDLP